MKRIYADAAYTRWRRSKARNRVGPSPGRWRGEEDQIALEMRARGKTPGQISFKIKRTPDAIAARLRYLQCFKQHSSPSTGLSTEEYTPAIA